MYNNGLIKMTYLGGIDDDSKTTGGLPKCSFFFSVKNKIHTCKPTFGGREKVFTKQKVFPAVDVWHLVTCGLHAVVRG